jgi:hypothetical protein
VNQIGLFFSDDFRETAHQSEIQVPFHCERSHTNGVCGSAGYFRSVGTNEDVLHTTQRQPSGEPDDLLCATVEVTPRLDMKYFHGGYKPN